MFSRSWNRRLLAAALLGLAFVSAKATITYPASFSEYCQKASNVALVRVTTQTAVFPKAGIPYTEIKGQLLRVAKGSAAVEITFVVPGARDGDRLCYVASAPRFQDGEEVLLFLEQLPGSATNGVLGLADGTYRSVRDKKTGERYLQGRHTKGIENLDSFFARVEGEVARAREIKK